MGKIKGKNEYDKFLRGEPLSRAKAIKAQCYVCNGENEGGEDCLATNCPLYQYFPYKHRKTRFSKENVTMEPETGVSPTIEQKELEF